MRGLDGAVAEVLLDAEQVDPAVGDGEADGHVLARHLAQLARREAGHQRVRAQLHLPHRGGHSASPSHVMLDFSRS